MSTNPPSLRFPFAISGKVAPEVEEAVRWTFNGLTVHEQAFASLKAQLDALTASAKASVTTINQSISSLASTPVSSPTIGLVNNQSGVTSYATVQSDYGAFIILDDASPMAVSLSDQISLPGISVPWYTTIINLGTGAATLTPADGTINGLSAFTLSGNAATQVSFDGTNFFAEPITSAQPNFADSEVVAGSGTAWTLAHTPAAGCVPQVFVTLPGFGLVGLVKDSVSAYGFSISGASITTVSSYSAGAIIVCYRY